MTELEKITEQEKEEALKNFMEEMFDFDGLKECGFFSEEMRGDYKAQAERVRSFFGFKTVYEYGAFETTCHVSYSGKRPNNEPFVTTIDSIFK